MKIDADIIKFMTIDLESDTEIRKFREILFSYAGTLDNALGRPEAIADFAQELLAEIDKIL